MKRKKSKKRLRSAAIDGEGLLTVLDSMVEAVFVIDDSGRVVLTNRALDALLERDARGSRPKQVVRSEGLRLAIRRARRHREATQVELEGVIGERILTFRAQVSPLPGRAGVVTVLHDVTSLKEMDRVRRDFVANATHELRTPVTAIRGYAETLLNGAAADGDAGPRFLEGILRQARRLQRLTEDLALLSRAESDDAGYDPEPGDIVALCKGATASLESLARKNGVRVKAILPADPVVMAVSSRALEGVLMNLLENAIKYTKPGGDVGLTLRVGSTGFMIEVRDSGIGIPTQYQTRIFERFFRVDQGRSRDEGGSGLGLAIVRHLVAQMGGSITVESELGVGSRFRVSVPAEPPHRPHERRSQNPVNGGSPSAHRARGA